MGGTTKHVELCPLTAHAMHSVSIDDDAAIERVLKVFEKELVDLGLNEEDKLTKAEYRLLATRNCLFKFYLFINERGGEER